MGDMESILEKYRQGDYEKRLSLFLECPSLRDEFIAIEQSEASAEEPCETHPTTAGRTKERSPSTPLARLLRCCHSPYT